MFDAAAIRRDWFSNVRADILAGIVVALALIPEAIGFSIIAGVDPRVGLYASVTIAIVIAFTGGRPGMISAATAAVAVVVVPLVRDHGVEYLFAATILMGIFQGIAALLRLNLLMQFVSRSVITGFVNALAILIFMAQLPQLIDVTWETYAMVIAGLAMIYLIPKLTTAIPSPLIAIIVLSALSIWLDAPVNTVSDMGELPEGLPFFALPDIPLTWETLSIIAPYSATMAAVGLLESLLTAQIVDDMTHTGSDKRRESAGQGIANIVTGFFGGMGGCAMIGQSVINVTSGGRGRLSALAAGVTLLLLLAALGPLVGQVPMPALVAIMIMVSIGTFSWNSIPNLGKHPWQSSVVMLSTVVTVVATHNLALGVLVGVLLSGIFFTQKVMGMFTVSRHVEGDTAIYTATGQIFFASVDRFTAALGPESIQPNPAPHVVIDVSSAHFWDISAIDALDKVVERMRRNGRSVEVTGLNTASSDLVDKFALTDKTGVEIGLAPHP
ncbi:SulP family inorganic anion transporter [Altererythrobacter sp.]|uniref:SulP family inorganic anion transporter n=1 Tax=Altererythrobacter sp. TaxID=1872480 RepID=UPI001B07B225|nr:SulP family inorganic anion transporter [Altererythrobacter sp.]MBO6609626.1 SulP family inorganic anion transporter [Altererythrobacter sp.]MBO6641761.1 SulP family inorganic anion transporter [Altererythrobacter sp.]MBO6709851.1 SulP family inorganic anion transporter [Altererythrobacter sp.]MBO6944159.1 SulP family inorganic anion transporter [Altererythrobacter sp.]